MPGSTGLLPLEQRSQAAYCLRDALLVLDEREANEAFAVDAEAAARAHGDMAFAQRAQRERTRRLTGRDRRPDEHRRLRPRHLPADAPEPVAQRVAAALVHARRVRRLIARLAQGNGRR